MDYTSIICCGSVDPAADCYPSQPNVVFVFADDLGLADVGYNAALATKGSISTPVLDSLATDGTILTKFYAHAVCTPARVALMTGRFAPRTNMKSPIGLGNEARALNEEEELLPEKMKELGYMAHMVGKWHLGSYERKFTPVGRGFDTYCGNLGGGTDFFYHNCELVYTAFFLRIVTCDG